MKSFSLYFTLLIGISLSAQTQNAFVPVAEQSIQLSDDLEVSLALDSYLTFEFQRETLQTALINVPLENEQNIKTAPYEITLPLPDGSSRKYRIVESPVMQSEIQARWPQLRTYRILDKKNPLYSGRLSVTPLGVQAAYQSPKGEVFLEPYAYGQDRYHVVYYQHNVVFDADDLQQLSCGYIPIQGDENEQNTDHTTADLFASKSLTGGPPALIREYHLALTCTGEYAQNKGGTLESVLASFVAGVNILNTTFEREVGIRAVLINQEEDLIFLHPNTDPFVNSDEGGALLSQIHNAITVTAGVLFAAYDMGHVFTAGCTDVGGVVSGQTCTPGKDRGVTCHYTNNLTTIVRRVMTHEIAHQFATSHTFSNCPGSEGQTAGNTAFEPGSGSTIMSYAGACGSQNIQFGSDDYYHSGSLEQFIFYSREGGASACATIIETGGSQPEVSLPYTDGFYIPISTPFELNGIATDMDDDPLTYCWEEIDLGFQTPLGEPTSNAPLFRSFPPTTVTNRYFPSLSDIRNNNNTLVEVLPTYSRELTFRFTTRDNNAEIGSSVWEDVAFYSTNSAGPFVVLEPNTSDDLWQVGEYREVRWDVANTDNDVVNCQSVNIRLSLNDGVTYPITLVTNAPNTGSVFLTVPDEVGTNMRIRVEAANNVFFDISNTNFEIAEATAPIYTLDLNPIFQQVCLPDLASVTFNTSSILGYDSLVSLSIISELPAGVEASFSALELTPGEASQLNIDLLNLENFHGQLPITIEAIAPSQEIFHRTLILDIVDNDFSEMVQLLPLEGQSNITLNTDFTWVAVNNADAYDWQLSDDAAFNHIIASAFDLEEPAHTPTIQLEPNDLFYWRVRAQNACGVSEWQPTGVFHTINSVCSPSASEDTPIVIPGTGSLPTRTSIINVPFDGLISDINVSYVNVRYQPIQNFVVTLISPSSTRVILYNQSCFSTDVVNIGFDDEAPNNILCPPNGQFSYRPAEPLSNFIGESSLGNWALEVQVLETGFGSAGQLSHWAIEFCADGNAAAPSLLTNETLFVPPLMANPITNTLLKVTDSEQGAEELTFTIVRTPEQGQLYLVDQELEVGSTFRQSSIDALNLYYVNSNPDATTDDFLFVIEDGTGGFLPVQRFNIVIDEDATVGTEEIQVLRNVRLYPNPASNQVTLEWDEPTQEAFHLKVYNVHGQVLYQNKLAKAAYSATVSVNNWPVGVYFVQLGSAVFRMVKQ